jgi:hypothetical protein
MRYALCEVLTSWEVTDDMGGGGKQWLAYRIIYTEYLLYLRCHLAIDWMFVLQEWKPYRK